MNCFVDKAVAKSSVTLKGPKCYSKTTVLGPISISGTFFAGFFPPLLAGFLAFPFKIGAGAFLSLPSYCSSGISFSSHKSIKGVSIVSDS